MTLTTTDHRRPTTDHRPPTAEGERGREGEGENLQSPISNLRRLRIAHVTATFPPYRSGTGNVCFHNARELARRGHEVHVFTAATNGAAPEEILAGVNVHRLRPLVRVGNAPVLPGLAPALRGFDVIHLHYPFFGGELTALVARLSRTPLVITYHQDVFLSGAMGCWCPRRPGGAGGGAHGRAGRRARALRDGPARARQSSRALRLAHIGARLDAIYREVKRET